MQSVKLPHYLSMFNNRLFGAVVMRPMGNMAKIYTVLDVEEKERVGIRVLVKVGGLTPEWQGVRALEGVKVLKYGTDKPFDLDLYHKTQLTACSNGKTWLSSFLSNPIGKDV